MMDWEDWIQAEIQRLQECEDSEQVVHDIQKLLLQTNEFAYTFRLRTRLAILYKRQQTYKQALEQYNLLIELNADEPGSYYNRGIVHYEMLNFKLARADFEKAIDVDHEQDYSYYYNLGMVCKDLNDTATALHCFDTVIRLQADDATAYYQRASVRLLMDDEQAALEDLNTALEIDQNKDYIFAKRADIHAARNQNELAIQDYDSAIALNSTHMDYYHDRGFTYQLMGKWDLAVQDYHVCLEREPQRTKIYYNMMEYHRKRGEHEWALQVCRQLIANDPDDSEHYLEMVRMLIALKRYDETEPILQHVIDYDAKHPEAYNMMGLVHYRRRHWKQALLYYNRAIELSPTTELYFRNRALVYDRTNKPRQAAKDRLTSDRLLRYSHLRLVPDHSEE